MLNVYRAECKSVQSTRILREEKLHLGHSNNVKSKIKKLLNTQYMSGFVLNSLSP